MYKKIIKYLANYDLISRTRATRRPAMYRNAIGRRQLDGIVLAEAS